jgi:hypothetical protein
MIFDLCIVIRVICSIDSGYGFLVIISTFSCCFMITYAVIFVVAIFVIVTYRFFVCIVRFHRLGNLTFILVFITVSCSVSSLCIPFISLLFTRRR